MARKPQNSFSRALERFSTATTQWTGGTTAFALACGIIVAWVLSGPIFHYSDTWQLVINTGTTIVTFLMVFLIQNSQNRDSAAIQVKLDELIRVSTAKNSFIGIEHLTDEELEEIRAKSERRAEVGKDDEDFVRRTGDKAKEAAERAVAAE